MKIDAKRLAKGLWWDRNWPALEGCTHCSPACDNCFAAEYAHRFGGALPYLAGLTGADGKWNGTVRMREDQLDLPLRTKRPTVWFVAERSDLFHPAVQDEYLNRIFAVMALCPQHTFLVLTKRPERMLNYFGADDTQFDIDSAMQQFGADGAMGMSLDEWTLSNLWLGTTVWDQASADRNIPHLLQAPAAHRFVSVEPMLGPVDLTNIVAKSEGHPVLDSLSGSIRCDGRNEPIPTTAKIDWVICGGESGHEARPMDIEWARLLQQQCEEVGVPFLLKQMRDERGRLVKAPFLDGKQHLEVPA